MTHNPKHRIAKLWKRLKAESDGIVHVDTKMVWVSYSGKRSVFWRSGPVDWLDLSELLRIGAMYLLHDNSERWSVNRKSFESDERIMKRTLSRLRKVNAQ